VYSKRRFFAVALVVGLTFAATGCGNEDPFPTDDELTSIRGLFDPGAPRANPGNAMADDPAARDLGARLFDDPGVSACGTVSCASCHPAPAYTLDTAGAHGCGGVTPRNPPTLLNVAYGDWFMWDGRKDSLWGQVSGPLLNPVEMAATPESLRDHLAANYASDYEALFGVKPQDEADADRVVANFGKVMEAYERTLIRVNAPFDQQVKHFIASAEQGQAEADPFYQQLHAFVRRGRCTVCHKGPSLSDGQFHDLGLSQGDTGFDHGRMAGIDQLMADPYNSAGAYSDDPAGGAAKLQLIGASDGTDGAFRTPTLRNVELTGPFMHNGSLTSLDDVINFYDRGGDTSGFAGVRTTTIVPLYLSDSEKAAIKALLISLTGSENP
jgi:cytochrome c peroxidase